MNILQKINFIEINSNFRVKSILKLLFLLLFTFSGLVFAESISVKTELADLIETSVKNTGIKINVPPSKMKAFSIEINSVNGLPACSKESKELVKELQEEFVKSKHLRLTYSAFGAYLKKDGKIKYLSSNSDTMKKLTTGCTNLYVSVYCSKFG